jgi:hypothetical protein
VRRDLYFEAEMVVTVCRQFAPWGVALCLTSRSPAFLVVPRRDSEAAEGFARIRRKGLADLGVSLSSPLSISITSLAS